MLAGDVLSSMLESGHGYVSGVIVTESTIITHHDEIPRFAAQADFRAVRDGAWSDPATWQTYRVPGEGASVQIPEGVRVSYDVNSSVELDAIEVSGKFEFATDIDTSLWLNEIMVMPGGRFTIGTVTSPISSSVSAEVVFTDTPGIESPDEPIHHVKTGTLNEPGIDPQQYGNGLLVFGHFETRGADKTAFVRATNDINANDSAISVDSETIGWRVGDEILLPETAQTPISKTSVDQEHSETVFLAGVSNDEIRLATVPSHDHLGTPANPFNVERFAHVGNLTRNVVFRSENANGVRGHFLATGMATIDVNQTAFLSMGRTRADSPVDNTIFHHGGGELQAIGTNQVARYPLHIHHLDGEFRLAGVVVRDGLKWGIAVHDADDGLIEDTIVFDTDGSAIMLEDGSETGNVFRNNLVVKVDGGHQRDDFRAGVTWHENRQGEQFLETGSDGSGFWLRSTAGSFYANAVYDAAGYGFNFNGYYRDQKSPNFQHEQIEAFEGNETVSSLGGLWLTWSQGQASFEDYERQEFSDFLAWNVQKDGFRSYHDANFTLNDFYVIGDAAVSNLNQGSDFVYDARVTSGIHLGNPEYENFDIDLNRIYVSGVNLGIVAPVNAGDRGLRVDTATIEAHVGIAFSKEASMAETSLSRVTFLPTRVIGDGIALPSGAANIWDQELGVIQHGTVSPAINDLKSPTLPAFIQVLPDGRLKIQGSDGDDSIVVRPVGNEIRVISNGQQFQVNSSAVNELLILGYEGDDLLVNETSLTARIYGGGGNDLIRGGSGRDLINGQDGDDELYGGSGDDILDGGQGSDQMFGETGIDRLHGRSGNDFLYGGLGDDHVLNGGDGDDAIQGGDGNDRIYGGEGNDSLSGGDGLDLLYGEDGDDFLDGGAGRDLLFGGLGRDRFFWIDPEDRVIDPDLN